MVGKTDQRTIKIKYEPPFFWPLIKRFNPAAIWGGVIVCWGDTIYASPSLKPLPQHLIIHETVHCRQQRYSKVWGTLVLIWYNLSPKFRLKCELEAYRAEVRYGEKAENLASHLASDVYGNIISYEDALEKLSI